jgi:hypothetical protein
MFPFFSSFATLAGSIIDIWAVLEERNQRELDREHQSLLQKAQHDHEKLLYNSTRRTDSETRSPRIEQTFLERLRIDALLLSRMGFEVVYEPIGKGYGVAIPASNDLILAFWISRDYPYEAPDVYVSTQRQIDKIAFEDDAWEENHTIADIVSAIALQEPNEEEENA